MRDTVAIVGGGLVGSLLASLLAALVIIPAAVAFGIDPGRGFLVPFLSAEEFVEIQAVLAHLAPLEVELQLDVDHVVPLGEVELLGEVPAEAADLHLQEPVRLDAPVEGFDGLCAWSRDP